MEAVTSARARDFQLMARLDGVGAVTAALRDEAERVREAYRDGSMTFDESYGRLHNPDAVRAAMRGMRWSFLPSRASAVECAPPGRFEALEADYYDWLRGPIDDTSDISSWLFNMGPARNYWVGFCLERWCTGVASGAEKGQFFKLCESAFTTIWEFASPPAGTPAPSPHFLNKEGGFAGRIYCHMDAAPLITAGDPVGKRFDLPLADGGTAHFEVLSTATRMQQPPRFDRPEVLTWRAMGWVEGYTRPVARLLDFTCDTDVDVNCIEVEPLPDDGGEGDASAFLEHPLWVHYWDWEEQNNMLARTNSQAAVERFLSVNPRRWRGSEVRRAE